MNAYRELAFQNASEIARGSLTLQEARQRKEHFVVELLREGVTHQVKAFMEQLGDNDPDVIEMINARQNGGR